MRGRQNSETVNMGHGRIRKFQIRNQSFLSEDTRCSTVLSNKLEAVVLDAKSLDYRNSGKMRRRCFSFSCWQQGRPKRCEISKNRISYRFAART